MRILIAEDDQVLADGLLRTLRASGAAVDHVASGSEADAALIVAARFRLEDRDRDIGTVPLALVLILGTDHHGPAKLVVVHLVGTIATQTAT